MATAKTPAKKTAAAAKTTKAPAAKTAKPAAVAKAPAKAALAKAAPAKKTTGSATSKVPSSAAKAKKTAVPPEQRRNYVEVAAYFIAERHGFTPGRELADWAAAEAEIDRLLAEGLLNQ